MKQCFLFHWLFCLDQIIIGQKARNWNCGVSNRLFENRFGKKIARLLPENLRKPKNFKKFKPLTFFELYIWIFPKTNWIIIMTHYAFNFAVCVLSLRPFSSTIWCVKLRESRAFWHLCEDIYRWWDVKSLKSLKVIKNSVVYHHCHVHILSHLIFCQ